MSRDRLIHSLPFLFSFLLPIVILMIAWSLNSIYPFGPQSLLAMDMREQYVHFYAAWRRAMVNADISLFSWSMGLGSQTVLLFSYYLSSPLNGILLLFSEQSIIAALHALTLLKFGLMGLSFAFFCLPARRIWWVPLVATAYALNSWAVTYSMCLMWLDAAIILPILAKGIGHVAAGRRSWLVVLSTFALVFSHFYIGYMVLLFAVLYFGFCLTDQETVSLRETGQRALRFGCAVLLGVSMAGVLLVPIYFALKQGKLGWQTPPFEWSLRSPLSLVPSLLPGYYGSITNSGIPRISVGVASTMLAAAAICCKASPLRLRARVVGVGIVLIGALSFLVPALDLFWHGLQYPVWFPWRFSFVFAFFLVTLAWRLLDTVDMRLAIRCCRLPAIGFCILVLAFWLANKDGGHAAYAIWTTLGILVCYALFSLLMWFAHRSRTQERLGARWGDWARALPAFLIVIVFFTELAFGVTRLIAEGSREFPLTPKADFENFVMRGSVMWQAVQKESSEDGGFRRAESNLCYSRNDPLSFGYRGVSHYSSSFDWNALRLLKSLGLNQIHFHTSYKGTSAFLDSFLGIRHVMSVSQPHSAYSLVAQNDIGGFPYWISENTFAFPMGLVVADAAGLGGLSGETTFQRQQQLATILFSDRVDPLFYEVPFENTLQATQSIMLTGVGDDILYAQVPDGQTVWSYSVNGVPRPEQEIAGPALLEIGSHPRGMAVRIDVKGQNGSISNLIVRALRRGALDQAHKESIRRGVELHTAGNKLTLKPLTAIGAGEVVLTTIPFDAGWKVEHAGQPLATFRAFDAFLAFQVDTAIHASDSLQEKDFAALSLDFVPKGLSAGILCSTAGFMLFGWSLISGRRKSR